MTLEEFTLLLETHGADLRRWPEKHREAGEAFRRDSDEGAAAWESANALDTLFRRDRERVAGSARGTAIVDEALRRIRISSERSFDWRWLFGRPFGTAAAAAILAGWLAGVFVGPALRPIPEQGVSAVSALLGDEAATIEDLL